MKKRVGLILAIIISVFALAGMGGSNQQPAPAGGQDYAVVDIAVIYQNSAIGTQAVAMLEGFQDQAMELMNVIQADIAAAAGAGDTEAEQEYNLELQGLLNNAQVLLEEQQYNLGIVVNDTITEQMEKFRQSKGLKAIFTGEALRAYDPSMDITMEAMEFLNAQPFDLGQLAPMARTLQPYQPAEAPVADDSQSAAPAEDPTAPAEAAPAEDAAADPAPAEDAAPAEEAAEEAPAAEAAAPAAQ